MRIDFLTLFPEMCETVMSQSIIGRAQKRGIIDIQFQQIRDYTQNKQKQVDDYPYGGGPGMVMNAQPIADAWRALCAQSGERPHTIYMTPQGAVLTQQRAAELSAMPHICLLCGHYEGVDERVLDTIVDEHISIGDYVLTGGELPALVLADCVARLLPGVLSDNVCFQDESHFSVDGLTGLLEYPHYTRPAQWEGAAVPDVLLTGHHANIESWRRRQSIKRTLLRRPDLLESSIREGQFDKKELLYIRRLIKDRISEKKYKYNTG